MTDRTNILGHENPSSESMNAGVAPLEPAGNTTDAAAAEESLAHVHARIRKMLYEPSHKRIQYILKDRIIPYPIFQGILEEIHWLILEPTCSRARGLIVQGVPNSGKTEIANALLRYYPIEAIDTAANRRPRVLMISMSGARTTKAILNRILDRTGVPLSRLYTTGDHETLVIQTLRKMNCRLLILDEIQDVLKFRESEQIRVFEVIKHLMNEIRMPLFALGADHAANAFRADSHLAARFESFSLPNWSEGDDFAQFLRTYEEYLALRYRSDLARPEIQKALIKRTGGITGNIVKLLKTIAMNAIVSGEERITFTAINSDQVRPPVSVLKRECV